MNKDRFNELMFLYLADKANREEQEELMRLIRDGDHDQALLKDIEATLGNGSVGKDMDQRKSQMMLKRILSKADGQSKNIRLVPARTAWRWIAAATVLMMISVGWWISSSNSATHPLLASQEQKQEYALFSGKQFLRLPDGSTVVLNEGSKLSYETSFGKQTREVTLTGEGYFDVQHDPSKPFLVLTGNITTKVLGTAFNVKAYPGDNEVKVSVTKGKVQVGDSLRIFGIITPDQQIAVNTITNDFIRTNIASGKAAEWQQQYLVLDDLSLEEAAKIIAAKYDVDIMLANEGLKGCRITATFLHGEDLSQVLTVVCGVVQATYEKEPDGRVKIRGDGCI